MALIQKKTEFMGLLAKLQKQQALEAKKKRPLEIAVDTETTGLHLFKDKVVGASVAVDTKEGYYFPKQAPPEMSKLAQFLASPELLPIGHNIKFDMHKLADAGVELGAKMIMDTGFLSRLLNENLYAEDPSDAEEKKNPYGLKPLAVRYFEKSAGQTLAKMEEWLEKNGLTKGDMAKVPLPILGKYGAEDARITLGLYRELRKRLAADGIPDSLIERKALCTKIAWKMERRGISVDVPFLHRYYKKLLAENTKLYPQLRKHAGKDFNPKSSDEVRAVLTSLGWKPDRTDRKAKTSGDEWSTDKRQIEKFDHPFVDALLEYKHNETLMNTFIGKESDESNKGKGVLSHIHKVGKLTVVHTEYNVCGADTTRWTSRTPNMQNADNKSDVRKAFIPRPGMVLYSFDFSQIEPTLMAFHSEDIELMRIFQEGRDWHKINAANAFNVPVEEVTPAQRKICKALGLGMAYGAGVDQLFRMMGVTRDECIRIKKTFEKNFPTIKKQTKMYTKMIETSAKEKALNAGTLVFDNNTHTYMYKGRLKMPQHKFVPKRPGVPKLDLGQEPAMFNWDDVWNDPDYWMFEDWLALEETGEVQNMFGVKRRLNPSLGYKVYNFIIQSEANGLLDEAVVRVDNVLEGTGGYQLLQVHDEILCEFPIKKADALAIKVLEAMKSVAEYVPGVPVNVDAARSSKSWGDMQDIRLVKGKWVNAKA